MVLHVSSPPVLPRLHQHQMHRDASWSSGPRWLFVAALLRKHLATWGYTNSSCCMDKIFWKLTPSTSVLIISISTVSFKCHSIRSLAHVRGRVKLPLQMWVPRCMVEHSKFWSHMVNVVPKHVFDRLLHVYLQFIYFSSAFQPPGLCTALQPFESLVWRCLELCPHRCVLTYLRGAWWCHMVACGAGVSGVRLHRLQPWWWKRNRHLGQAQGQVHAPQSRTVTACFCSRDFQRSFNLLRSHLHLLQAKSN